LVTQVKRKNELLCDMFLTLYVFNILFYLGQKLRTEIYWKPVRVSIELNLIEYDYQFILTFQ
jgi:hypothetical protein